MDFKKQLESELDKRYVEMLKGSSKPPFDKETVSSYQSFKNKNTSYHQRIDKEQREFNNALSEVTTRRNRRIEGENRAEYDRKKSKAHAKYAFAKFLKTIAMLLPVVLAIFVGVDIFTNKALYEVDHSFGWIVTGWVAFSLASLATTITLLIKLFSDESFEYEEYRSSYRSYHREDNRKKYAIKATVVTIVVCLICCINFGTYIKWGMNEVDDLALKINMIPTHNEVDYDKYENQIEEVYDQYSSLDFWQKIVLKNEDRLLNLVAGFNQHKVDKVKSAMNLITLETVSQGDILTNAVALYSELNDEQRALLTQEETQTYDKFSTVNNVVNRLFEINDDIVDQYGTIDDVLNIYQALDDNYKAYVYNYNLVPAFAERYEYFEQFLFEAIEGGGYSIKAKGSSMIKGELVIPERYKGENVVKICENAFKNNSSITSVVVPNTVKEIGVGAFQGCNGIATMTLPFVGHLSEACAFQSSGNWSLNDAGILTSPNVGNNSSSTYTLNILSSGVLSFYYKTSTESGCDKLKVYQNDTSVVEASGETDYTYYEFNVNAGDTIKFTYSKDANSTKGADKVYLNFSTTYFGYIFGMPNGYADQNNYIPKNLSEVSITEQKHIPEYAFYGNTKITELNLPTDTQTMGAYVLYGCTELSRVNSLEENIFNIPTNVKNIGKYAFYNCAKLKQVTHGTVEGIGNYAFANCSQLSKFNTQTNASINIGSGCKTIGEYAFANCGSITSVIVSDDVTNIGLGAFSGCEALERMALPFVGHLANGCAFKSSGNWILNDVGVLSSPSVGNNSSSTYTLNITTSGILSFYYRTSTESGCDKLTVYKNDSSVTTASGETGYAYYEISVTVGDVIKFTYSKDSNKTVGDDKVYLNFSTTYFGYVFGMPNGYVDQNELIPKNLADITITEQKHIPEYAFYGNTKVKSLTLPADAQSMGVYAFYGCSELSTLNSTEDGVFNIPSGVSSIGNYSFYNCLKMQKLICGNITSIGSYAFYDCKLLSEFNTDTENCINIDLGCKTIGEYAFGNCNLITSIVVAEDVTSIGVGAFFGCSEVERITLPFVGHLKNGASFSSSGDWSLNASGILSSPNIGNNSSTTYTLNIKSAGVLSFYYKTSTESGYDKLTVYKNGTSVMTASGQTGYVYYEITVTEGDVIKFTYSKDSGKTAGDDKVYLNFNTTYFGYIFGMSNSYADQNNYIPQKLTEVTITDQNYVAEYAFYNCTKLQKINYNETIGYRGKNAFQNCTATVN